MFQAITGGGFRSPAPEWLNASLHTVRWHSQFDGRFLRENAFKEFKTEVEVNNTCDNNEQVLHSTTL